MISRKFHSVFWAIFLASTPLLSSACGGQPPAESELSASGTLSLPLLSSVNGHRYRLSNATVYIYGPQNVQLYSSDDPNQTALSTTLTTGNYSAHLYSWSLERENAAGNFVPVPGALVSSYVVPFAVFNGTATTISYQFQTDGVIVTVGSGELRVTADVVEIPSVCTPFGSECGEGAWCPPTDLTGMQRACFPDGAIALGQPCSAVTGCIANASCFDLGEGPICAALCPSADFDLPCATGGTCRAAGSEYGVCRPLPASSSEAP